MSGGMPNLLTCSLASLHSATMMVLSMSRWSIISSVNFSCSNSPSNVNLNREETIRDPSCVGCVIFYSSRPHINHINTSIYFNISLYLT